MSPDDKYRALMSKYKDSRGDGRVDSNSCLKDALSLKKKEKVNEDTVLGCSSL